MKGLRGPETCKRMRKLLGQFPRRPYILSAEKPLICGMTALSHQEVFSLANKSGMDQILLKPIYEVDFKRALSMAGIPVKNRVDE